MSRIFFSKARFTAVKVRIASIGGRLGFKPRGPIFGAMRPDAASIKYPILLSADILPNLVRENMRFTGKYILNWQTGKFAVGSDITGDREMAEKIFSLTYAGLKKSPGFTEGAINIDVIELGRKLEFRMDAVSGFGTNLQRAMSRLKDILKEGGYDTAPETARE